MSEGQIRLGIPGAGTTDFATSPIGFITLDDWEPGTGIPTRKPIGTSSIGQRSNNGVAAIVAPAYVTLYGWDVVAIADLTTTLQLGALARYQDTQQKAGNLAPLRLIDETDYLDPEPNPHSKTLLTPITPPWNGSYRYGYGVFGVQLILPADGWRTPIGVFSDGTPAYRVAFALEEL